MSSSLEVRRVYRGVDHTFEIVGREGEALVVRARNLGSGGELTYVGMGKVWQRRHKTGDGSSTRDYVLDAELIDLLDEATQPRRR